MQTEEKIKLKNLPVPLTFYNYKEPLVPVKKGYGYMGVVLGTEDGSKIQCHICGELYEGLDMHVRQSHNIEVRDYKEKYGLAVKTALVSEKIRYERKERTIAWLASMTEEERRAIIKKARQKYKEWRAKMSDKEYKELMSHPHRPETKNKRGTCPDQLIQKIKDAKKSLGHTPSKNEFIDYCGGQRFLHLIYKTFGSWSKGVKMAGMKPKEGFAPNKGEKRKPRYEKEELLEYLRIFYQENGRPPTETDTKRGLIPDSQIYRRLWGGMPAARLAAGITDEVGRWKVKT